MVFYTIPYIIIFLFGIVNIKINTKSSNNFFFFILCFFSAFRQDVGYDYMGYMETISSGSEFEVSRLELLERYTLLISRETFPQIFFIVNSIICVYFIKFALDKLSSQIAISAIVFYCFPNMFLNSMGVVRFWTGLAIVLYASSFLKERKILKYLFFQILALFFHNGSIIGLLFIPLYFKRIPYAINVIILVFSFFGGEFILNRIISGIFPENLYIDQLVHYASLDVGEGGMSKIPYIFLSIDLLLIFGYRNLLRLNKNFYQYFSIYNIGVSLMFLFSFQSTLSLRLSLPFLVYLIILIPFMIQNITFNRLSVPSKLLIFECFSFVILCYTITIFNQTLGRSQYLPYKIFFL